LLDLIKPFSDRNLVVLLDEEINFLSDLKDNTVPSSESENVPKPIISKTVQAQVLAFDWAGSDYNLFESLSVLDFHPTELARQMTLIDHRILALVPLSELHNGNYLREADSPYLSDCSKRFNIITQWIGTLITTNPNVKERLRIIKYFIVVSVKLLSLNNFQGLMAIFVGLSQYTVSRMENTWAQVTPDLIEKWSKVQTLCSPLGNFKRLREKMAQCELPCVMAPTLFIKDQTFLEDGNKQHLGKKKEYFNLYRIVQSGIYWETLRTTQKIHYELKGVPFIQAFLESVTYIPVKEQESHSRTNDVLV